MSTSNIVCRRDWCRIDIDGESRVYVCVFVCCTHTIYLRQRDALEGCRSVSLVRIIPRLTQSSFDLSSMSCIAAGLGIDVALLFGIYTYIYIYIAAARNCGEHRRSVGVWASECGVFGSMQMCVPRSPDK